MFHPDYPDLIKYLRSLDMNMLAKKYEDFLLQLPLKKQRHRKQSQLMDMQEYQKYQHSF